MNSDTSRAATPAVSFILPVYNCSQYVGETLRSIFAQTFQDYEIVLVNDGSTDAEDLERVLRPYRDRIVYIEQENRGASAARNRAIRAARSEILALMDADDVLEPDYLAVQMETFRATPGIDVLYPNAVVIGESSTAGRTLMDINPPLGEVTFESLATSRSVVTVHAIVRKSALARAGYFDEQLRSNVDFDLWLRIAKSGGRFAYHDRVLVRYRRREGSISADAIRMCAGAIRVLDKAERTMTLGPSEKEAVAAGRLQFHASLRYHEAKRYFLSRDWKLASAALKEANLYFRRWKFAFASLAMQVAPNVLLSLYRLRERFLRREGASV